MAGYPGLVYNLNSSKLILIISSTFLYLSVYTRVSYYLDWLNSNYSTSVTRFNSTLINNSNDSKNHSFISLISLILMFFNLII